MKQRPRGSVELDECPGRIVVVNAASLVGVHTVREFLRRGFDVVPVGPLHVDPSGLQGLGLRLRRLQSPASLCTLAQSAVAIVTVGHVAQWPLVRTEATLEVLEDPALARGPWALHHPQPLGAYDHAMSSLTERVLRAASSNELGPPITVASARDIGARVVEMVVRGGPAIERLTGGLLTTDVMQSAERTAYGRSENPHATHDGPHSAVVECLRWALDQRLLLPR